LFELGGAKMKKVLMIALMLVFFAGTASATTYVGLFNNAVASDPTLADCSLTAAAFSQYHVFLVVNADDMGCTGLQCKIDPHSADVVLVRDYPNGGMTIGDEFAVKGYSMAGIANLTGWNVIADLTVLSYTADPRQITIGPYLGFAAPIILDKNNAIQEISVNSALGVNVEGVPTAESSWGAVKSMYR
jgi:hypothetical protein